MNRPYVILHMLTSIDGKITGDFLSSELADVYCEEYYRIHREYASRAFACGRITMEGSFTQGAKPDLSPFYRAKVAREDYVAKRHDFYAVSIDPHGRLGWSDSEIHDPDPGYDDAHIIEVLTAQASDEYVAFLKSKGISYIFCGEDEIDCALMLKKLFNLFGIKKLMLEGGGLTDTLFFEEGLIDEISLVAVPMADSSDGIDLFANKKKGLLTFKNVTATPLANGGLWLNYKN
ncbi:MAG: dihydrofolate reductase family protein [Clostridia bacterium]|nr:dihydrofolate reductase family protein [Clostridia bacterium]